MVLSKTLRFNLHGARVSKEATAITTDQEWDHLSFRFSDDFVKAYENRKPPFGFDIGGGNTLGELTWLTKYSRTKPNGTKERWFEGCRRVVEGTYSILKDHCAQNKTPWNAQKAQRAAEDMYDRLWSMKWTPPGRGLWMMGTKFVADEGSAALQNCSFISTDTLGPRNATLPFVRLMEMSMLGIGVGFDTRGAGKLSIHHPTDEVIDYVVPDSREGWCESLNLILRSYLLPNQPQVEFNYSEIRPAGEPIKRFGGVAAGPDPLSRLHTGIKRLLGGKIGESFSSTLIVDVGNMIGKCVVAGNVRRSAEIALGFADDQEFLALKDWNVNPDRMGRDGWGHLSNNSVMVSAGDDLDDLVDKIAINGEPGILYMDLMRSHGRLIDSPNNKDHRAKGCNPCAEQTLEHMECCTLVETYPVNCEDFDDFKKTLKAAYMYGKAVTLLPTHWPESNEVMKRNHRIGTSVTGLTMFAEKHGWTTLREWLDDGYAEIQRRDQQYSEWLGVRESVKTTSVKPSGTVSLLAGVTPGVHWPVAGEQYFRRVRYSKIDPIVPLLEAAGYHVEASVADPEADVVVTFPTTGPKVRSEREVSVWEKVNLAGLLQRYWADNMVSATFTFAPHEEQEVGAILRAMDGQLKSMSFLPMGEELSAGAYEQMPYEKVSDDEFSQLLGKVTEMDMNALYASGREADGERFCSNDVCEVKF